MLRQDRKVRVNPRPCCEAGRYLAQEKAFYRGLGLDIPAGARPRPASVLEGSRLCRKESSSPEPESGEQWTPFGKVTLVSGGKKTQGA